MHESYAFVGDRPRCCGYVRAYCGVLEGALGVCKGHMCSCGSYRTRLVGVWVPVGVVRVPGKFLVPCVVAWGTLLSAQEHFRPLYGGVGA